MKTIQNLLVLVGLSVALFAMGTTQVRAQVLESTPFAGTFTLPSATQWGPVTLPAGDYALRYGHLPKGGPYAVEIVGQAEGNPRSVVLAAGRGDVAATKNAIVCVRHGGALIVRSLEMPAIGESVRFLLPRGAQLVAHKQIHNGYTQLAEAPMLIQRIPVKPGAK